MDKNNHKTEEPQPQKKGDLNRKILKEKEKITSDGRQSATKAQDQRASQSGAISGKRPSFCDLFTISKRLSLGLVASARILRRSMFDLFADE